jgi:hypothetical protein
MDSHLLDRKIGQAVETVAEERGRALTSEEEENFSDFLKVMNAMSNLMAQWADDDIEVAGIDEEGHPLWRDASESPSFRVDPQGDPTLDEFRTALLAPLYGKSDKLGEMVTATCFDPECNCQTHLLSNRTGFLEVQFAFPEDVARIAELDEDAMERARARGLRVVIDPVNEEGELLPLEDWEPHLQHVFSEATALLAEVNEAGPIPGGPMTQDELNARAELDREADEEGGDAIGRVGHLTAALGHSVSEAPYLLVR